jgi:hypothetical protein
MMVVIMLEEERMMHLWMFRMTHAIEYIPDTTPFMQDQKKLRLSDMTEQRAIKKRGPACSNRMEFGF